MRSTVPELARRSYPFHDILRWRARTEVEAHHIQPLRVGLSDYFDAGGIDELFRFALQILTTVQAAVFQNSCSVSYVGEVVQIIGPP